MARKKKKSTFNKVVLWVLPILIALFTTVSFILAWSFLSEHAWTIFKITGAIILVFIVLGYINRKEVTRWVKRRFRV